jgi:hypothetical protein
MKTITCELNDQILNAINFLKDCALKHAGNNALQPAVDVSIWLQTSVEKAKKQEEANQVVKGE